MSTLERVIRRATRDFAPMEGLVAAVAGVEHLPDGPGRRRLVAVATDRRILLAHLRPASTASVPYAALSAVTTGELDHRCHLTLHTADGDHRIDGIEDAEALSMFVALVSARRRGAAQAEAGDRRSTSVRLVRPA